jgi:hypothetical protein
MGSDQDSWIGSALGVDVASIASSVAAATSSAVDMVSNATSAAVDDVKAAVGSDDAPSTPAPISSGSGGNALGQNGNQSQSKIAPSNGGTQPASDGPSQSTEQDAAREQSLKNSDYYKQGYEDGVNGGDPQPPPSPAGPDAMEGYQMGYDKGHADYLRSTTLESESDRAGYYNQGYKDGLSGGAAHPPPESAGSEAVEGYKAGFADGQDAYIKGVTPAVDMDKVIEHVVVSGVIHIAEHLLHIGGGIYSMLVDMTVDMECDTKMFMFKCATCGQSGEARCTEEEAQADANEHQTTYPGHVPEVSGPGSQ